MRIFKNTLYLGLLFCLFSPELLISDNKTDSLSLTLKNAKHDSTRYNALFALGNSFQNSDPDTALLYFSKALSLSEKLKDEFRKCSVLKMLGQVYYDKGDYVKSEALYNEGLALAEKVIQNKTYPVKKVSTLRASIIGNIGLVYMDKGDYSKAIEYFFKTLRLYEELDNKEGQAVNHCNVGICYAIMSDYPKALEFLFKSLKVNESLGYKSAQVDNLSNIGNVYKYQGEYAKALEFMLKGLKIDEEQNNKIGQAALNSNIATVYDAMASVDSSAENYSKALEYHVRSLKLNKEIGRKKGQCINLLNMSYVYIGQKRYKDAEKYLQEASLIVNELDAFDLSMEIERCLSELYDKSNRPDKAFVHYKLYIQYKDSLFNKENTRKAIQQEYKFNYEKKATADSVVSVEEKKVTAAQLKQEKTFRFALFGGLALVVVFAGFMFNRFKVTNRQKKIIELKEQETQKQNEVITHQKNIVEEKQKEILDSIGYAKRIQNTLLAHHEFLQAHLPEHFVLFQPKDIVSGDFYWAIEKNNKLYIAVCDSTGHGVPGAFMSLLNISFLNEAINEKNIEAPNEVFNFVRQRLIDNISKEGQKDGFDGILVCIDKNKKSISYAAANNAPVLVRENVFEKLESDRMPVGMGESKKSFSLFTVEVQKGDMLYLYTDGYADQFGGPKGKKFRYKPFNELLLSVSNMQMEVQHKKVKDVFDEWQGDVEQIDDVCVMGIKI